MYLFRLFFVVALLAVTNNLPAQVLIHSHNDYDHAHPFWDAYSEKANSIEADVFPVKGELMVAHAEKQITSGRTIDSMYLHPIIHLFLKHHNKTPSADPRYTFYLMIDIKEKWDSVLPLLIRKLQKYPAYFDRNVNPMAVQVFISGDRPPDSTFHAYPPVIMFDGLPGKKYAAPDLKKIVMISTDFSLYSHWNGEGRIPAEDAAVVKRVIEAAHKMGKPVRFWGAPDTQDCWETLIDLGADVINTDKVGICKKFLRLGNH